MITSRIWLQESLHLFLYSDQKLLYWEVALPKVVISCWNRSTDKFTIVHLVPVRLVSPKSSKPV